MSQPTADEAPGPVTRVAVVNMPFASHRRPSLQAGLLTAIACRAGHPARSVHLNVDFAALIGLPVFDLLAEQRGLALGDWLFAEAAFGDAAPDPDRLLPSKLPTALGEKYRAALDGADPVEHLAELRGRGVPAFVEQLARQPDWSAYDVVAFTCTFQQTVPSLALARSLRRHHPDLVLLFGGANFDDVMGKELVRCFDVVDFAIQGEADVTFPLFLDRLAAGGSVDDIPGLLRREGDQVVARRPPASTTRLDDLPCPDYDDFFARIERIGLVRAAARRSIDLPVETARGCWWGEKRHCTFCGLNGQTMAFRSKSAERVITELDVLSTRYRSFHFEAVDNILDPTYIESVIPRLISAGSTYNIFYEVKANLDRDQLTALRSAGISRIQPGIESLSSHVLRSMRKGVRAGDNVNLLRWAKVIGIDVSWNVLWGFPGETEADYTDQATLIRNLTHLQPPTGAGRLWLERFSPLFTDTVNFPMVARRPEQSLEFIYPNTVDLDRIAYFFDYELADTLDESAYRGVQQAVVEWQDRSRSAEPPSLDYFSTPGLVLVVDRRESGEEVTHSLRGEDAAVYRACSVRPRSIRFLHRELALGMSIQSLTRLLERLTRLGLMMCDKDRFLALALPAQHAGA